ncbi:MULTISPECIES: hypothetical protein [Streptomyces]|uniref:Uncharacterized protein n=1 Tax=Streptomyces nigrescens TaxID=1920 RepID=A0ABY7JHJ0_STRNI|nr:hypothetical protein [Streptomyces nigrescens]WAU02055.1 hypothetical protein STRNI_000004 [Streptomyces nigrescens]WAU09409.1 hypothetical protein STRNI_008224 [Streptomyces nigrescens]
MAKKTAGGSGQRARSAKTGRMVTMEYARRHPTITVVETVKRRSAKK